MDQFFTEPITVVIEVIRTGGVIAVLLFMLIAFFTGRMWTGAQVQEMNRQSQEAVKVVAEELRKSIQEAVRQGIVQGMYDIRMLNGQRKVDIAELEKQCRELEEKIARMKVEQQEAQNKKGQADG